MDTKDKLRISNLGLVLFFYGLGSTIMKFIGFNFILMYWVDFLGEHLGWVLRISFIFLGLVLYFKYQVDDDELNFEQFEEDNDLNHDT